MSHRGLRSRPGRAGTPTPGSLGDGFRLPVQLLEGAAALLLGCGALGGGELPLEPVQGAAAPHRAPLEKPQALHHVGAENQPGVGLGAVHAEAHAPCLAALLLGLPGVDDPRPQGAAGSVQAAGHHRGALQQARLLGRLGRDAPHHLAAGDDLRQQRGLYAQLLAQGDVPLVPGHIVAGPAIALALVLGDGPCQAEGQIAVGLEHLLRLFIDLGQVLLVPQHLGQSVRGGQGVAAAGENLPAAHTGLQFLAEGARPGVHPDGGVAQGPALLVQGDGAPALAVDAHACHLTGGHGAAFPQPPEGPAHGLPPLLGVLLRPARLGVEHRVAFGGLGQHVALQVEGSHLAGGGAHVNA